MIILIISIIIIMMMMMMMMMKKPRTINIPENKNEICSTYPIFFYSNKLLEDTASIFKFTQLIL